MKVTLQELASQVSSLMVKRNDREIYALESQLYHTTLSAIERGDFETPDDMRRAARVALTAYTFLHKDF